MNQLKDLVALAFKAVALAMSVAVVVLNALKTLPVDTTLSLLGIGLFALSMASFMEFDRS